MYILLQVEVTSGKKRHDENSIPSGYLAANHVNCADCRLVVNVCAAALEYGKPMSCYINLQTGITNPESAEIILYKPTIHSKSL